MQSNKIKKQTDSDKRVKSYQSAIRYLAPRARSVHEIRQYLAKKGFDEEVIETTIEKLEQDNLLNDYEFASMFVEQRERFKPKSKFALAFELKKKGVEADIIESCVMDIDENESAFSAVQPKIKLWQSYDDERLKKKVMNYLRNRGFSYEVCISTFKRLLSKQVENNSN
ncbi:MAG: regulatory protein RecX [Desulfamplus sp.]|nr:regulatory protein RecX [Desulfamplus sp.]